MPVAYKYPFVEAGWNEVFAAAVMQRFVAMPDQDGGDVGVAHHGLNRYLVKHGPSWGLANVVVEVV